MTRVPRPQFLAFTCGLLRGTLSTLGVKSLVTASVAALPACELGWGVPIPRVCQGPPLFPGAVKPHCRSFLPYSCGFRASFCFREHFSVLQLVKLLLSVFTQSPASESAPCGCTPAAAPGA